MDLLTRNDLGISAGVNKFMLAGESKRGWTTWMTGPIDDRVIAMAPVVLSNLNMNPVSNSSECELNHAYLM
jgi:PhoPQ-activated pathogenicity-related protein